MASPPRPPRGDRDYLAETSAVRRSPNQKDAIEHDTLSHDKGRLIWQTVREINTRIAGAITNPCTLSRPGLRLEI